MTRRPRATSRVIAAIAGLAAALPASASWLGQACAASDIVIEAKVVGGPDEFGLCTVQPGRAARRPPGLGTEPLLVRLPERARRPQSSWMLCLVPDAMARSLGAWTLVDEDVGALPIGAAAGSADDLLACADLALALPVDPGALGDRLAALVGRGDAPTRFALEELTSRPELLQPRAERLGPALRTMLAGRSISPETAALAVQALGLAGGRGDDARLIDLVASEAPGVVVEAVAETLPALASTATSQHLEHAFGGAPSAALPGLLRLVGPAGARSLLPMLHERLASSRQEVRLAALASVADLADPSSSGPLRACSAHPDPETARAARAALSVLQADVQ